MECMCACAHVCVCVRGCIHTCILVCVCRTLSVSACVRVCACERVSTCVCVCVWVRVSVHAWCTHVCVRAWLTGYEDRQEGEEGPQEEPNPEGGPGHVYLPQGGHAQPLHGSPAVTPLQLCREHPLYLEGGGGGEKWLGEEGLRGTLTDINCILSRGEGEGVLLHMQVWRTNLT